MFRPGWKSLMTPLEVKIGLVFFLLYYLVFPRLNALLQQRLFGDGEVLVPEANVLYYVLLFLVVFFLFHRFLREDFFGLLDWLSENLAAAGLCLLLAGAARILLSFLPLPVEDLIAQQYAEQFQASPFPTLALILILIPLVEETLYRGLLYGLMRRFDKKLAIVVSILFYVLSLVWRYAYEAGDPSLFLLSLLYLPLSAAATLCYEAGGSVWAATLVHGGYNGLLLFMALH